MAVFNGSEVLGSVVLACSEQRLAVLNKASLVDLLKAASKEIGAAIEGISHPQAAVMALDRRALTRLSKARQVDDASRDRRR